MTTARPTGQTVAGPDVHDHGADGREHASHGVEAAGDAHGHAHGHGHSHHHAAGANRSRLIAALCITAVILGVEVVGAIVTGSLALLVDAAHMLTDAFGLVVALVAATLMSRPASTRQTWGWARAEVVAAAAQAALLLVVGGYAIFEGVQRLIEPPEIGPSGLALVGVVGLVGNAASLLVLAGGKDHNLNMRAAFLEVANDALGSAAVLVSAGVIALTGWHRVDPIAGLLVAALIVPRAVLLLRESGAILLESTPPGLDLEVVRTHIAEQPHVAGVHDLHASTVASGMPVLTAHVVLDDRCVSDGHSQELLSSLQECVASHHGVRIEHCTFQLESQSVAAAHLAHLHA